MFTWTNQPYESMWNHLKMLTYQANAKALLNGQLGSKRRFCVLEGNLLDKKSAQLAYSIKQAYQYYKAADLVSIDTSPLLYFYGMLSLSKALIVANHNTFLLDNIKYHGLFTRPITSNLNRYVTDDSNWCIEQEYAVTNDGVFKEFLKIVQDFSLPNDSIIRFKDVISIDPEMSNIYTKYYNEIPKIQYLYKVTKTNSIIEIVPATKNQADFESRFPHITNDFELQPHLIDYLYLAYKSKSKMDKLPENIGVYYPFVGGKYLISSITYENNDIFYSDKYVIPVVGDYINMFILSNCVRYKQEFWGQIIDGSKTGAMAIINLFISIARNRFPNFILNYLFGEVFEYGTVGRLM